MKKLLYLLIGIGIAIAGTAVAINVTVPQSPAAGSVLFGNANGTYNSSTSPFYIGSNGFSGFGTTTPIGRLTIQGMNNLSTGYPFSVFNASGTPVIVGRNDGYVGIGTTGPATLLHLSKVPSGVTSMLQLQSFSGTNGDGAAIDFTGSTDANIKTARIAGIRTGSGGVGDLAFSTWNGSLGEVMRITSTGNVGIGTINPSTLLTVQAVTSGTPPLALLGSNGIRNVRLGSWNSDNAALILADSSGNTQVQVAASGTSYFNGGNIGIGLTNPASTLDIKAGAGVNPFNIASSSGASVFSVSGVGLTMMGSPSQSTNMYAFNNSLNGQYGSNANATLYLNYYGYQGGVTQFRDTGIMNGKSSVVLFAQGSTKFVGIATTTPNATLWVKGSVGYSYSATNAATYTIATSTDNVIYMASSTAAQTINLPACASATDGNEYTIKDSSGNAATNNKTISATGSSTIEGALTKIINTNFGLIGVQCTLNASSSPEWFITNN